MRPRLGRSLAGGDDGLGLLASQHGLGNFRRVGKVGEAGLVDGDAGLGQTLLQFGAQSVGDFIDVAKEGRFVLVGVVVAVGGGEVAQGTASAVYCISSL